MSVLLAGNLTDVNAPFGPVKPPPPPPRASTWDTSYGDSASIKHPLADTTAPPPAASPVPEGADHGCGVCARAAADSRLLTTGAQSETGLRRTTVLDVAIRCTTPNCSCDCFTPGRSHLRTCDNCQHGWVAHALDKLGFRHLFSCHQVELVQPTAAYDVASLMLYGTQAVPIRLKILLDRLFSVLQHEEVLQVLHGFGWTYEDYARGYILQDSAGQMLDKWTMASRDEEPLILQQFLRFGETKPLAQQLLVQESSERPEYIVQATRTDSDIKKFIQRTSRAAGTTLLKTNSMYTAIQASLPVSRALPPSSVSSTTSLSPTTGSPVNSPLSLSPLNKLQNMHPHDFRRERTSPEVRTTEASLMSIAQSTPMSSPTTTFPPISSVCAIPANHISRITMASDHSATDGGSEEDTNGAINLSRQPATSHMDSIFAARKVKHLRKSANPMKRRWNPLLLSNLTTNPSTGKKRVQCHVCLKTFCDKGALKIHFSAVHLREMHKCTVDGCNMMFSSRRSRNRHSANPNPKLHTPNYRRKISPHDGRSANPFPLMPPSSILTFNNTNNHHHPLLTGALPSMMEDDRGIAISDGTKTENLPSSTVDDSPRGQCRPSSREGSKEDDDVAAKKPRLDKNGKVTNDGDEGMDLTIKDSAAISRGVRKRKSFNPTKLAVNSDDDLQYVSTDDSSSDTFIDNDDPILLESKSDDDVSSDLLDDDSKDGIYRDDREVVLPERKNSISYYPADNYRKELYAVSIDLSRREPLIKGDEGMEEVLESPLRHLETLSLGAFTGLLNPSRNHNSQSLPTSTGVSYHAPGLGLATSTTESPGEKTTVATTSQETPPVLMVGGSCPPAITSSSSGGDQESEQQMPLLPIYRDASIVGSLEIPVDKDNPRRCTACGKVFQNHFGVKTHYQNVHLKLMHKCTVEGCNAAFPSKRSRDRHSANLNLHRKLLSTSSSDKGHFFDKSALFPYPPPHALREDYFSRLYDPQSLPLNFADLYHGRLPESLITSPPFSNHLAPTGPLGVMPSFHPAFMVPTTSTTSILPESLSHIGHGEGPDSHSSSLATTPSPQPNSTPSFQLADDVTADDDGRFMCTFCQRLFQEISVIKDHYETFHGQDLFTCTVDGCTKAFLSRKARNSHSESAEHHHQREPPTTTS